MCCLLLRKACFPKVAIEDCTATKLSTREDRSPRRKAWARVEWSVDSAIRPTDSIEDLLCFIVADVFRIYLCSR